LDKIPSASIIFVAGNGDLSFCPPSFTRKIIAAIKEHKSRQRRTFYLQSKRPAYLSLGASEPASGRRFKTSQLGSCLVM
jgi:hypothetical protein